MITFEISWPQNIMAGEQNEKKNSGKDDCKRDWLQRQENMHVQASVQWLFAPLPAQQVFFAPAAVSAQTANSPNGNVAGFQATLWTWKPRAALSSTADNISRAAYWNRKLLEKKSIVNAKNNELSSWIPVTGFIHQALGWIADRPYTTRMLGKGNGVRNVCESDQKLYSYQSYSSNRKSF